ncbi:hypothetical protein C8R43DRAFT_1135528 [Mycena crocata]|nr:hypothetical protein C8R43DRAFT_1135528 [Mycena crocata]
MSALPSASSIDTAEGDRPLTLYKIAHTSPLPEQIDLGQDLGAYPLSGPDWNFHPSYPCVKVQLFELKTRFPVGDDEIKSLLVFYYPVILFLMHFLHDPSHVDLAPHEFLVDTLDRGIPVSLLYNALVALSCNASNTLLPILIRDPVGDAALTTAQTTAFLDKLTPVLEKFCSFFVSDIIDGTLPLLIVRVYNSLHRLLDQFASHPR